MPFSLPTFRRARAATPAWNLTKTAVQTAAFWLVFLVLIPRALVALEQRFGAPRFECPSARAAWTAFALASCLGLWSGATMALVGAGTPLPLDAPRHLVVRGPYRYVRNPMAVAGLSQGACVACLLGSWSSLGMVLAGFVLWNYGVRPVEERDLEAQFGAEFSAYRIHVRCWLPRFPGFRGRS